MLRFVTYHQNFNELIDSKQNLKKISSISASGMAWLAKKRRLDYVDALTGRMSDWTALSGEQKKELPVGRLTSMLYDCCNRLVACDTKTRKIVRFQEGKATCFGDYIDGVQLSPKAVTEHSCSILYFADPSGIYYALPENLKIIKASGDIPLNPISLCVSENEEAMYFTDANTGTVSMLDFMRDATLACYRTLAFACEFPKGAPTDIKVDCKGNVYCAAPSGIHIFDHMGRRLGNIEPEESPVAICFGGEDLRTLFIATKEGIYAISVKNQGRP